MMRVAWKVAPDHNARVSPEVVVAVVSAVVSLLGAVSAERDEEANTQRDADIYDVVEPFAHRIKAIFQMVIAIVAVCVVGWQFLNSFPTRTEATTLLLDGIGIGLAAAAVVELAYTLFTSGPDEALDPLMLGLSAAILIELGRLHELTVGKAGALLLLGVLLAILFAARLFLAERHGGSHPKPWWANRSNPPPPVPSPRWEPTTTEAMRDTESTS
jgi:hypothetical protein